MCPFLSTSRAVCCSMIDWKKGLELALKYWVKRPWKALSFFKNLWCRKPVSGTHCLCCIPHWITILTFPVCGCVSSSAFQHCHCWSLLQYLSWFLVLQQLCTETDKQPDIIGRVTEEWTFHRWLTTAWCHNVQKFFWDAEILFNKYHNVRNNSNS